MSRASHLRLRYGITEAQYDELLEKQHQRCFVCLKHQDEFKTRLCVDHNHKTGEVRGVLCGYCNHRLIGRHTDPDLLRRMAEYLEQGHTGWFVPEKKKKNTSSKRNRLSAGSSVRGGKGRK